MKYCMTPEDLMHIADKINGPIMVEILAAEDFDGAFAAPLVKIWVKGFMTKAEDAARLSAAFGDGKAPPARH